MKENIPLKKDILFKTLIGEITNINLEHDYKIKDDLVEGNILLSGSYKMTEASVIEEDFFYKVPFSIAITKKIKKDTIKIEIEDFNYEILKDVLHVNINLELTCDTLEDEPIIEESSVEEDILSDYFKEENEIKDNNINIEENINNITNTIINNENKYYTYKIYIVRQGDTLESICNKYNVSLDILKEYNDINELNIGDKLLIPDIHE